MLLSIPVQQRSIEAIPVFLSPHQEAEAWLCKWGSAPRPACLSPKPSACCSWLPMQVPASLSYLPTKLQEARTEASDVKQWRMADFICKWFISLNLIFFHFVCKIFVNKSAQDKQGCVQKQLARARNLLSILIAMLKQGGWKKPLLRISTCGD